MLAQHKMVCMLHKPELNHSTNRYYRHYTTFQLIARNINHLNKMVCGMILICNDQYACKHACTIPIAILGCAAVINDRNVLTFENDNDFQHNIHCIKLELPTFNRHLYQVKTIQLLPLSDEWKTQYKLF